MPKKFLEKTILALLVFEYVKKICAWAGELLNDWMKIEDRMQRLTGERVSSELRIAEQTFTWTWKIAELGVAE